MGLIDILKENWNRVVEGARAQQEAETQLPEPEITGPAPEGSVEGLVEELPSEE